MYLSRAYQRRQFSVSDLLNLDTLGLEIIMEENISLSDSELSNVDEEQYANIPTTEVPIDTSPEYSPITEPMSFSPSVENYLPLEASSPGQNIIGEVPLTLPIEYLAVAREMLILMVMM